MKEFATGHIRNVALVAHHGVGKTTLAEAMLFQAKATTLKRASWRSLRDS